MSQLPEVNCKYGAPMGRANNISEPDYPVRFQIQKLRWVDGDYDEGGAYWGKSNAGDIYWAKGGGEEEFQEMFVRAHDVADVQKMVRTKFENATFLPPEPVTDLDTLDEFTEAYITAALWSSSGDGDDCEFLDSKYSADDIAPSTLEQIIKDCKLFQEQNATDIKDNLTAAGHDFWLTRNGHGSGFWDGDWPKEVGNRLTEASKVLGGVDLYVGDDGKIYS